MRLIVMCRDGTELIKVTNSKKLPVVGPLGRQLKFEGEIAFHTRSLYG